MAIVKLLNIEQMYGSDVLNIFEQLCFKFKGLIKMQRNI